MLTDEQKLVLHMCIQAEKAGRAAAWISRDDLLSGKCTPENAPLFALFRLMYAALAMPKGVLEWSLDGQKFRLSDGALQHIRERAAKRLAS